ncbi:tyrosine-type recombinase/integrase [Clostridium perfringens]|uniref:tyrosine-type recombinase/integrase n=1 Tax=Clostridium perfringens TaxID=1502 RepID=UPI001CCCED39|nr:tyrosine-type recombinase/integrase [Clostridium perfringens]MDZ4906746.1 tyrosine-type recombinase/integrase [Clostridium perfringens]UBK30455.1 tyrosine-type recombinase/integrase [Clostridium perfringens]
MRRFDDETIKYLTSREYTRLINAIKKDNSKHSLRNFVIFNVAYYCGLRVSEVGLLNVNDYNPNNRSLYCHRLKGSNNNTIRLSKEISRILNLYIKEYGLEQDDILFKSQHGKPISRQSLDVVFKNYAKVARIKDTSKHHFHVLKHTRAVDMLDSGFNLEDIRYLLGHKNIANTSIYAQFSSNYKRDLFDKMDRMKC